MYSDDSDAEMSYDEEYHYDDSEDDSDDGAAAGASKMATHQERKTGKASARRQSHGGEEYSLLDMEEIEIRKNQSINTLKELLCVGSDEAQILLRINGWDPRRVQDMWFNDQSKAQSLVGATVTFNGSSKMDAGAKSHGDPRNPQGEGFACNVCLESYDMSHRVTLSCAHTFCKSCLSSYVDVMVKDGPGCTELQCPQHGCPCKLGESVVKRISTEASSKTFSRFMNRSFVEFNRNARWCPAAGCEFAVEVPGGGGRPIDITCPCPSGEYIFCFSCGEEAHRPASCEAVRQWKLKNSAECENVTWIMANTKPCPKCNVNIEKNQGCNHMTCRKQTGGCGHEFCWLCMGPWSEHSASTGGYYKCNKYEAAQKTNKSLQALEAKAQQAKTELNRYMHYFERWHNHNTARKAASKMLGKVGLSREKLHSSEVAYKLTDTAFMEEACRQIVDSRRVLEWTYVFGYYLKDERLRDLFEHMQERLEKFNEHLHSLLELNFPVRTYIHHQGKEEFFARRKEIVNLMAGCQQFRTELLSGLEDGLGLE